MNVNFDLEKVLEEIGVLNIKENDLEYSEISLVDKTGSVIKDSKKNTTEFAGVVLSGTKIGLIELANYLINVALSEKENDHLHLDELNFFDKSNVELIIVKKEDS